MKKGRKSTRTAVASIDEGRGYCSLLELTFLSAVSATF
jgi:hypothetical protein